MINEHQPIHANIFLPFLRILSITIHEVGPSGLFGYRWPFRSVLVYVLLCCRFLFVVLYINYIIPINHFLSFFKRRIWRRFQAMKPWLPQPEKEQWPALAAEDEHTAQQQIAWKRVIHGLRQVCETAFLNFHWACKKCSYVNSMHWLLQNAKGCQIPI
jgi:hypothetical protein